MNDVQYKERRRNSWTVTLCVGCKREMPTRRCLCPDPVRVELPRCTKECHKEMTCDRCWQIHKENYDRARCKCVNNVHLCADCTAEFYETMRGIVGETIGVSKEASWDEFWRVYAPMFW